MNSPDIRLAGYYYTDLTLTLVVFESNKVYYGTRATRHLTLTLVVFESRRTAYTDKTAQRFNLNIGCI